MSKHMSIIELHMIIKLYQYPEIIKLMVFDEIHTVLLPMILDNNDHISYKVLMYISYQNLLLKFKQSQLRFSRMYSSHITPKRRHSSLFERMENEIKKISKKLSIAKESYRESSNRKMLGHSNKKVVSYPMTEQRKKEDDFLNSMNSIDEQTVIATARNQAPYNRNVQHHTRKNRNQRPSSTITNNQPIPDTTGLLNEMPVTRYVSNQNVGKVIKGLSTMPLKELNNEKTKKNQTLKEAYEVNGESRPQNSNLGLIKRLQDENSNLSFQLGRISSICQNQSYKVGKLKAELRQTSRQMSQIKERQEKQNCYLVTLLEHYKEKAQKYKRALRKNSQVSIDIESDSLQ